MGGCLAFRSHFRCIAAITIARSGLRVTDLSLLALSVCRCEIKRLSLSEVGNLEGRLGGLNKDNGGGQIKGPCYLLSEVQAHPTPVPSSSWQALSVIRSPSL